VVVVVVVVVVVIVTVAVVAIVKLVFHCGRGCSSKGSARGSLWHYTVCQRCHASEIHCFISGMLLRISLLF